MKKKTILVLAAIMACVACVNSQTKKEATKMQSAVSQKQLGALYRCDVDSHVREHKVK